MSKVMVTVVAKVEPEHEEAFNRWYNEEHAPQVLELPGCIGATRFRDLLAKDERKYMAVYEFVDEAAFDEFWESDTMRRLVGEFDDAYGEKTEREASAFVQIWP